MAAMKIKRTQERSSTLPTWILWFFMQAFQRFFKEFSKDSYHKIKGSLAELKSITEKIIRAKLH